MSLLGAEGIKSRPIPGIHLSARFSIAQFDAMIDAGVFLKETDRQIQLLNGEIVIMTPSNPRHDDVVRLLSAWAFGRIQQLQDTFEVCVQLSMNLDGQDSVVLPDLMLVAHQSYSSRRPNASDTRLLVEVSDTTLAFDLNEKMGMYAEANVVEYWVIDIPQRSLTVHRDPAAGCYRSVQIFDEHASVSSVFLPEASLSVRQLFR